MKISTVFIFLGIFTLVLLALPFSTTALNDAGWSEKSTIVIMMVFMYLYGYFHGVWRKE